MSADRPAAPADDEYRPPVMAEGMTGPSGALAPYPAVWFNALAEAIVGAIPPDEACLADEEECFERYPIHLGWSVEGEVRTVYARVPGLIEIVLEAVVPLIRERVAAGFGRTCQDTAPSVFVDDSHLHECEREAGHRSPVHRCACGCEWRPVADVAAAFDAADKGVTRRPEVAGEKPTDG